MQKSTGVVVQDTAWEGYEDIPLWIMQGYGTLIDEAIEQIENLGQGKPNMFSCRQRWVFCRCRSGIFSF